MLVRARDEDNNGRVDPAAAVAAISMMASSQRQSLYSSLDELPEFEDRLRFRGWTPNLVGKVPEELPRRRETASYETHGEMLSHQVVFSYDVLDKAAELAASSVATIWRELTKVEEASDKRAVPEKTDAMDLSRYETQIMNQAYKLCTNSRRGRRVDEARPRPWRGCKFTVSSKAPRSPFK